MTMCEYGCTEHFGCRLRLNGVQVSPQVGKSTQTRNWRPTPSVPPGHYSHFAYEDRPGGFKSPILRANGTHMRKREYLRKEPKIQDQLARIRAGK